MNKVSVKIFSLLLGIIMLSSCGDDAVESGTFTVTIENIFQEKSFLDNGVIGFIEPGASASYEFNAGQGHYLSFATMLVQSNDLFYGPDENGIRLYENGVPVTGDVTHLVDLWDAGTEVNEQPGTGNNQAPRQSGADTGQTENGTVELIENINDGYTYPADEEIIRVSLAHDGGTQFTLTISNISNTSSLPTPFAPGVYAINSAGQAPLFEEGSSSSVGLERLAEDGNNEMLNNELTALSGYVSPFAPGAYSITSGDGGVFTSGTLASSALEALAEDGDPSGFASIFNTPEGASSPGPLLPGGKYSFSFTAEEGDKLSFATMLVQSNDLFVGPEGLELFNNGVPISGDITSSSLLWDAYTEVNEYPGAGNNQPVRQAGPNTGVTESANVNVVSDAFTYPAVSDMVRITISN